MKQNDLVKLINKPKKTKTINTLKETDTPKKKSVSKKTSQKKDDVLDDQKQNSKKIEQIKGDK